MKIAKEFRWEMGHRLKFHKGTYKMMVEFSGEIDGNGMVLDYYDVKEIIAPIVEELDHGFLVYEQDKELVEILKKLNSKHTVVNFESTAENLCKYFLKKISEKELPKNINGISVRVFETENTYAEEELIL